MAIALVAHVGKAAAGSGGGTSSSIDTTGANLLVLAAGFENSLPTVADSKSNTWTPIGITSVSGALGNCVGGLFISVPSSVGASHTFSVTGTTLFPSFCVAAFSGDATSFLLGLPVPAHPTTGTSVQAGSLTPGRDNCLVVASMAYRDTTTITINGGFTITDQEPFVGATGIGSALAYLIQTSATAANPTWSWTNSVEASAFLAAISAPVASGGTGFVVL